MVVCAGVWASIRACACVCIVRTFLCVLFKCVKTLLMCVCLWQNILVDLENHRSQLESEIAAGHQLIESGDVPKFVSEAVVALTDTVNETMQLASMKYQSLKVFNLLFHCTHVT